MVDNWDEEPDCIENNDDKAIHNWFIPTVISAGRGEAGRLRYVAAVAVIWKFCSSKQESSSEYQYCKHVSHQYHPAVPFHPPTSPHFASLGKSRVVEARRWC
jgi:hypothetical protein